MNDLIDALGFIDQIATIVLIILILILIVVLKNLHTEYGWQDKNLKQTFIILVLMLAYPLYTSLYLQLEIGLAANLIMLFLTLKLIKALKILERKESKWLLPQAIWLSLVSLYVLLMLLQDYLIF